MLKLNLTLENPKPKLPDIVIKNLFNKDMNYYICSSGGCGSTILYNYLSNFGNVYHIHDRYPPNKLSYVGSENTNQPVYSEWFNETEIEEENLHKYKVIFLYRNPIQVIFSRFAQSKGPNITHLKNIKCINDGNIWLGDVIRSGKDLYGIEDFFDNYITKKERNYTICCVKYEQLFDNFELFNKAMNIPDIKNLYPIKVERRKYYSNVKELSIIYSSLINKMNSLPFISFIYPKKKI